MDELTFEEELEALINKHGLERASNTPDFILASFMAGCLHLFNNAIWERQERTKAKSEIKQVREKESKL